jgi:tRNA (guanosine-2'-O-)-methyltransferase
MPRHQNHVRISSLPEDREERIAFLQSRRWSDLEFVIEQADDPHNIGAMLRTCDAVGIGTVHLVYGKGRPPRTRELTGTAMSAAKWLTIKKWDSVAACVADLKSRGLAVYVTALTPEGKSQWEMDWTKPSAIVMGNESDGITPEFLAAADGVVAIPMRGFVQSLNVSVSAAVVMYEALRQRLLSFP